MFGMSLGEVSVIANILFVLLIVSAGYNTLITKLGVRAEGYVWLQVVVGVAYTLIAIGVMDLFLDWNAFFIGALAFAVSGLPMCLGAIDRHLEASERARKAMKE